MKRTTYILLGLIIAGFFLTIGGTLAIFLDRKMNVMDGQQYFLSIEGEQQKLDIAQIRVVMLSITPLADGRYIIPMGEFEVIASEDIQKGYLTCPKNDQLKVSTQGDTLLLKLMIDQSKLSKTQMEQDYLHVKIPNIRLEAGSALKCIHSEFERMEIRMNGLNQDSLCVRSFNNSVVLDSCRFRSLDLGGNNLNFTGRTSKIENFYLDLDGSSNWTFENSCVGTEFLTGSYRHTNSLQKGECKRVVWTPKNKDAILELSICERSVVEVTPDSLFFKKE